MINFKRKVAKVGDSYFVSIPMEIVRTIKMKKGDEVYISLSEQGVIEVSKYQETDK